MNNKKKKITGSDFLLLFLYLNDCEPINSAVRLTKMMFIFEEEVYPLLTNKNITIDNLPVFMPYNYGPFSKDVYVQLELFNNIKFIQIKNLKSKEIMEEVDDWEENSFDDDFFENQEEYKKINDGKFFQFILLETGKQFVEDEILEFMSKEDIEILEMYKKRIVSTSIRDILKYVYVKYPKMTENSIIKTEILGNG